MPEINEGFKVAREIERPVHIELIDGCFIIEQLEEATRAQVFNDVDSAYAQVKSNVILLRPYKDKYLDQATRVRETITFSWQRGAASLMDFLNAQSDYRQVQLAYVQLVGSYLTAASELNLAVGSEVMP